MTVIDKDKNRDPIDGTEIIEEPIGPLEFRYSTCPIPTESIREYFNNKNVFFLVNYSQSRLEGAVFLTYLANINVPADVCFDMPLNKEEYFELMQAFMSQRMVSSAKTLHLMMAQLILWSKGVDYEAIPYKTSVPEEYVREFAIANKEKILKWLHFVDSSFVFTLTSIGKLRKEFDPINKFEIIDDKEYVGHNVVNLFGVPHFTELYFGLENAAYRFSYFAKQFEEYMFGNKRFAEYFIRPNNFIQLVFVGMAQGIIDPNNVEEFLKLEGEKHDAPENG